MTTSPDIEPATSMKSTHEATGHTVDFSRDLCLVLGLPFDVIDLDTAVARIRSAVASRTRLFISTPNTNFAVAAMRDSVFRDSVFHSDLSLMDGMPLVWAARLMGIEIPQRVSGSDLFEALRRQGSPPISVYFFGGQPGTAANAAAAINAANGPMRCVGFDEAGFGSVEAMSDQGTIERINASGADFLVVSIGAVKGQAWIEHNLPRLRVPVVSYLGAVVGFVAGSVKRAPPWMRRSGLEWLWRVKEEPHLWKRYAVDALTFGRLLIADVFSLGAKNLLCKVRANGPAPFATKIVESDHELLMQWSGALCRPESVKLKEPVAAFASTAQALVIDLIEVTSLDWEAAAILASLCSHRLRCGLPTTVRGIPSPIKNTIGQFGVAWMLENRS
jgi:N-acetylglucosaminyldiphosphoundecaprenol N-acetyl-beta-D-mannosaminyltransferase